MRCPSCGAENEARVKFCTECGTALQRACPACAGPVQPGQRFCGECGTSLEAAEPAASPAQATEQGGSERRLVTVLFADLVGFTTLSESRDAEDVRELLSRYFDACRRLIELYGGVVEKFIGDAVMAVWGAQTATEDDAERAVRAALDLVAAVSALGQEVGAGKLQARAGVMTGEAAVTLGAAGEGMVAGDLVNTASRVQSVAEPGQVFVGESTRRATDAVVVYADAGTFELKGKDGLMPLWHALRVVSGVRGALKSEGLEAPFVGRDRELRTIKDMFHASAEEGRAHLVSVTGVAGIGKSRLGWEFYKYFDGLAQIIYWHRGRCLSYGEGVTYWALADMVRMRCRIGEEEAPHSALGKLQATLEEHLLDADERRFVEPRLAQLLGLGDQSERDRQELFSAWRVFFERLSEVYPTVLVFEDMQWADASLLDFVEYLLDATRSHPLLVITLARPELLERRSTWGAGLRNFTSIYLEPLSAPAMNDLLVGLVPGLPETLRNQILDRAEGIPLYAVETVRMLIDRGALVQHGAVYQPVGEIGALAVPETLHALIAARLDGLPIEERRLLQDGAVLGKTFSASAVADLSGLAEEDVLPLLTALVRKEVLAVQADPRSPEHGQYGFLQDLVRRVCYETLSRRDRKARHLAAARQISGAQGEEDVAELVAAHLVDAYRADPDGDDATAIRDQAREALVRAGDRARSLGAPGEAQRYFEQAAELVDDPAEAADLSDRAGQVAWLAGRHVESRSLYERAHAAYTEAGDDRAAVLVSARLAELDWVDGHPDAAVSRLEPALAALAGTDDADVAVVSAQVGRFLALSGRGDEAAPYLESALALAEALVLPEVLVQALTSKSVLLLHADRLAEAQMLLEGAIDYALEHELFSAALRSMNNLGVVLEAADQYHDVVDQTARMVELARRVGDRRWETTILAGSISSALLSGRWDEAFAFAEAADASSGTPQLRAQVLDLVAIHIHRGELTEAKVLLEQLTGPDEWAEPAQANLTYAGQRTALLRAEGRTAEAEAVITEALGMSELLGVTDLRVKLAVDEALEVAFARGDDGRGQELLDSLDALRPGERTPFLRAIEARHRARFGFADVERDFREAERIYDELQMPMYAAMTRLEHAEWLVADGQPDVAVTLAAEAREDFQRLGALPFVERAARIHRASEQAIA